MARILREASSLWFLLFGLAAFSPAAFAQASWDLAVSKSGPSQVAIGVPITYSIGLTNYGPDDATGVTLTDAVPGNATFVSFSQNSGPAFSCSTPAVGAGGTITCTIATFVSAANASFTLVVDTAAVANGTFLTNIASVSSPSDVTPENDDAPAVTLVGGFADVSVFKTGTASVLDSGGPISYGITLGNSGPDAALAVSLSDTIPAGTTFVSFAQASGPSLACTTPAVGSAGGTITCTIATLSAGASASFTLALNADPAAAGNTIINTASASYSTADPDPSNDSGSAFTAVVAPSADLAITKTGPASVTAGGNVSYSIGLVNNGPQAAQSTTWTDTLPAGTTFVSLASAPGFACTTPAVGAAGTVNCSIASLASGSSAAFTLVVQSSAAGAGTTITNTASASTTTIDPGPANNSASAVTAVVAPAADLAVTKTGPASVAPGANVSYSIGLVNNGPDPAQSTVLTDTLPAGTTFVSLAPAPGFVCTTPAVGAGGTVSCSIAALASGAPASFTLVVKSSAAGAGTTITNTASASSTTVDPAPANNSASASTALVASADLAVTKTATANVSPGSNITYNIGVSNNGPSPAQAVTLTDALPAGTTFVSLAQGSGPAFTCTTPAAGTGGTVSCSLASFASGSSAAFTLVVQAGASTAGTTVTNTASASSATADPNPANGAASASTGVGTSADLAVAQTVPSGGVAGANITYNITLANNGPSAAQTTALSDVLPTGTTFVSLAQSSGPTFTCTTPAVGAAGTVSCNIASLASAVSAGFTLVVRTSAGSAGTTISNTASASSATPDPNAANNSSTVSTPVTASQTVSGSSPTGGGTITAAFVGGGPGCTYSNAQFIPLTGDPRSPPAGSAPPGVTFPYGLFDFTASGCIPASTLVFTITYPAALPAGTQWWKYGPRPGIPTPMWYVLPATVSGNTVTFSITDGLLGDDDLAVNGTIVDQGGPGVPPVAGAPQQIPTLSEWMELLLAMLLMGIGMAALRRRSARIGR